MDISEIINCIKLEIANIELSTESDDLLNYGRDWTRFHEVNACCVVFPKTTEQVQKLVQLANQHNFKIVPSGGRTGYSAGAFATQGEVVVSMEKMRNIIEFNQHDAQVTVQSGVITEQLQNYAEEKGLFYPVDFASSGSGQMSGNIASSP